ncbi:MAG: MmgE/PrpD family protein, partial [Pollutimonas bauzanensis]
AGIEAGWRVRRAITGARPGLGFHSPGVFGTLAAAAAAARVLRLDAARCGDAMAIALTRASGLAVNSAASMIGMTHFGWGTLHGLEAALLAAHGWSASPDVQRALSTLFGEGNASLDRIVGGDTGLAAATNLVFKHYPCNIYANLLVQMLEQVNDSPLERIHIRMPWIPHLDCPAPRDVRQARNSVQAVAAVAGAGDTSYAAFSGPPGPWQPAQGVRRLLASIELDMDRNAPTQLNQAVLAVRAWRGGQLVLEAKRQTKTCEPVSNHRMPPGTGEIFRERSFRASLRAPPCAISRDGAASMPGGSCTRPIHTAAWMRSTQAAT